MQTYRNLKTPNKGVFRFLQYNNTLIKDSHTQILSVHGYLLFFRHQQNP